MIDVRCSMFDVPCSMFDVPNQTFHLITDGADVRKVVSVFPIITGELN